MPTSAVVLLSGGQDSTTCLFWAKRTFDVVHAVSFRYGQRHAAELDAARKIAEIARTASWKVLDVRAIAEIGGSSLIGPGEIRATGGMADRHAPAGLPTSFVPGRNLVFLGLAASYAVQVGAGALVIGVGEADYSGYPDCRKEFIDAMQAAVDAALPSSVGRITIETPLMNQSKSAAVTLARAFGDACWEALGWSITCYEGHRPGCGTCPACVLRARGFHEAGLEDPAHANHRRAPRLAQVGDWTWSSDGEVYGDAFSTREEAIADALRELEGEAFYVAQVQKLADAAAAIKVALDEDGLRDVSADYLYDNYGFEDADDRWQAAVDDPWKGLTEHLHEVVDEWCASKDLRVNWYVVGDAETIVPDQLTIEGLG